MLQKFLNQFKVKALKLDLVWISILRQYCQTTIKSVYCLGCLFPINFHTDKSQTSFDLIEVEVEVGVEVGVKFWVEVEVEVEVEVGV